MQFRAATDLLVVHCAATPPTRDIGVVELRRMHVEGRGWEDVGYHYVVRRNGVVEVGRPERAIGAHVEGHNGTSVGICLVGGLALNGNPAPAFLPSQLVALKRLIEDLRARYPGAAIRGHRDFPGVAKACPSFNVAHWVATGQLLA